MHLPYWWHITAFENFEDRNIGLLCTVLYTLSVYRLSKTYICGSLGETFGILFLPLIACGFYLVFAQDVTKKQYHYSWIPLTIGFTGLVQSHLLTGEQAGAFTILLCLILIKRYSARRRSVLWQNSDLQCIAECLVPSAFC